MAECEQACLRRDVARYDWSESASDAEFDRTLRDGWVMPAALQEVCAVEIERSLADRFFEQADKWRRETEHLSSPTQMMLHPSYQAILGMAREDESELVRLMLRDLRDNRRLWFWALSYLTKENPIKPADVGKLDKMIKAWVNWGLEKGKL